MDDKNLKAIMTELEDIKGRLAIGAMQGWTRGPVADPGPAWGFRGSFVDPGLAWGFRGPVADPGPSWGAFRGPVADPGPAWGGYRLAELAPRFTRGPEGDPPPEMLLDKAKLAQLKVRKLDIQIAEIQKEVDLLQMERDLLAKEYNIS